MPFGLSSTRARFSKKKTYTVQEHNAPPHSGGGLGKTSVSSSRRNSAPAGILKRGGSRPVSYPALEDGMVPQEMARAIPMPTEAELNELFVEMVVSRIASQLASCSGSWNPSMYFVCPPEMQEHQKGVPVH